MSSILNGSSAIRRFERSNAIEICNGITFDFYTGLPHMYLQSAVWLQQFSGSDTFSTYTCTHTYSCGWRCHYLLLSHWGSARGTWWLKRLWTPWNCCCLIETCVSVWDCMTLLSFEVVFGIATVIMLLPSALAWGSESGTYSWDLSVYVWHDFPFFFFFFPQVAPNSRGRELRWEGEQGRGQGGRPILYISLLRNSELDKTMGRSRGTYLRSQVHKRVLNAANG